MRFHGHTSSIHVPCVGGRPAIEPDGGLLMCDFNPRPLHEGTTWAAQTLTASPSISIHVPCTRGRQQNSTKNKTLLSYLGYPFHKILSITNPIFPKPLHFTAKGRYSAVRTSRQMGVHLGFAPANWVKSAQKSWTQTRPALLNRGICKGRAISPGARPTSGRPARESAGDPPSGRRLCRSC